MEEALSDSVTIFPQGFKTREPLAGRARLREIGRLWFRQETAEW